MKRFIHICVAFFVTGIVIYGCTRLLGGTEAGTNSMETFRRGGEADDRVDMDFTVCEEGRLPAELVEIINEKKSAPFKLTFTTREYMYIVVGYGAQQRGGCAVTVNALYRTSQAVYIDTNLIGSEGESIKIDGMTYPYVAVKCENQNLPVVYE